MRYSPLVQRIAGRGAAAWDTHIEARRRQEEGEDIIFLTVGDPDQDPPASVIEATVAALRGAAPDIPRSSAIRRCARRSRRGSRGAACGPAGSTMSRSCPARRAGSYCAVQCLAGPGDEIIVPEPIYATYEGVVGASGATLVTVPLRPETGFHPDPDALAAAVTPRTRVMWINTPHNPTGAVFTGDEMAAIAALCRRHDLWLLSDEVYEDLAFARPHVGAWSLPDMAERTVVVSSLSKSHAMPGFRLGWVVGPPALIRHLFNLLLSMTYGGPAFIQDGALAALTADLPEVAALREDYRSARRADVASCCARRRGAASCRPRAACSCCSTCAAPVSTAGAISPPGCSTAEGVAVLPCDGFGAERRGSSADRAVRPRGAARRSRRADRALSRGRLERLRNAPCGRAWRRDRALPK